MKTTSITFFLWLISFYYLSTRFAQTIKYVVNHTCSFFYSFYKRKLHFSFCYSTTDILLNTNTCKTSTRLFVSLSLSFSLSLYIYSLYLKLLLSQYIHIPKIYSQVGYTVKFSRFEFKDFLFLKNPVFSLICI